MQREKGLKLLPWLVRVFVLGENGPDFFDYQFILVRIMEIGDRKGRIMSQIVKCGLIVILPHSPHALEWRVGDQKDFAGNGGFCQQ